MSWDFELSSSGNKQNFTVFPQGITRIRLVDNEPHIRWTHWINEQKRTVTCPGSHICPICEIRKQEKANKMQHKYNMSRRFTINVINRETGKLEIMEQGITFFENLKDLKDELDQEQNEKSLTDIDLKVRRKGEGMATTYRIDFDEEVPFSEADIKLMEEKVELSQYFKPHTPEVLVRVLNGESLDEIMKELRESENEEAPVLK